MRAFLRWASLVAAVALLTAAAAYAQTIGADGVKAQSLGFTRVGGITAADSIGRMLKLDASGNLKTVDADRDRDFSEVLTVLDATPLAAGATKGGTVAVNTAAYSSMSLMLRWTFSAAADSDSVNIVVKVFAKRSTAMDDGMNHLWTPRSGATAADTAAFLAPAGVATNLRIPSTYYVTRNGTTGLKLNGTSQGYVYTIPLRQLRWAGNGGIDIPMSDCGIPFNAQYVGVEITNANISKALATVTAELWPRVN